MYLTPRQKDVLDFITGCINVRSCAPTYEEIAKYLGLTSLATVHKHITNLEKKGYISRAENKARALVVNTEGKRRFEVRGAKLYDNLLNCYWVREETQ